MRKLLPIPGDPPANYLVGTFRHADGRRAVILMNDSYSQTAWVTGEFDADSARVIEISKITGEAVPVADDSPELKGL